MSAPKVRVELTQAEARAVRWAIMRAVMVTPETGRRRRIAAWLRALEKFSQK